MGRAVSQSSSGSFQSLPGIKVPSTRAKIPSGGRDKL